MSSRREPATKASEEQRALRRARALAAHATDLPVLVDAQGVIHYVGESIESVTGYRAADVLSLSGWDFVHPDDEPDVRRKWADMLATPGTQVVWETRVRHSDGHWVWIEERVTNLLHDDAVAAIVINVRDVSDKHTAYQLLHEREEFYREILATAQEGVWVVDASGKTQYANDAMAEILGVELDEVLEGAIWNFVDADTETLLRASLQARLTGTSQRAELEFTRRDGERRVLAVSAAPLRRENGAFRAAVGMCMDVTERKRQERELHSRALHDPLTGLPNRHLLADRLEQARVRCELSGCDLTVLFVNVDRFKLVNDSFGHDVGDRVLQKVSARLRSVCRDSDTLARFGGDEFVVVCPDTDNYVGLRLAETLRATFDEPFDIGGAQVTLGVSVGVASTETTAPEDLVQSADRAAQRAKLHGRGRIEVFDPAARRLMHDQLQLVNELRRAIRDDQLALHYQPIVGADGQVYAVEALLRWTHPDLGPISPIDAVRAAEDNGVMASLGEWILRRACDDIAHVSGSSELAVAVNLSARQLVDGAIVRAVDRILRESALVPERLTLEVTETSVLLDADATLPTLHRLKEIGVRIALDDFGTGYSSLSYLRDFPVDAIKIDRSFVAGMMTNRGDVAIVATLTNLAASVGLHVVAEGVETQEQAETIRQLGASYCQGYLYSPPVPVAELPALLEPGRFAPITKTAVPLRRRRTVASQIADESDRARILELHQTGASPATIAAALNAEERFTLRGTRWHRNTVAQVIAATFPELEPAAETDATYPTERVTAEQPADRDPTAR